MKLKINVHEFISPFLHLSIILNALDIDIAIEYIRCDVDMEKKKGRKKGLKGIEIVHD